MATFPISGFETPYKLLRRFEAFIESIFAFNATVQQVGFIRYKPMFASYISCVEAFKSSYSEDYSQLGLEEVALYDEQGNELFTREKLSTILHQAQSVVGVLKGLLPPALMENPGGITILVSSQAASQSSAESTAQVQFTLVMEALAKTIQNSELDQETKDELNNDIDQLKNLSEPDESKIKALATKLGRKLQEMGENVAVGVIDSLLRSRMGF